MVLLAIAVSLLATSILAWVCYRTALQNGRLLLRIEGIAHAVDARRPEPSSMNATPSALPNPERAAGLALGTVGNDFDLPDLRGGRGTLSDHLGSRVLLVFIAPDCPHSRELLAQIAPLPRRSADDDPVLLIVATGGTDENLSLVQPLGIHAPVLIQEDWEVGDLYWVQGTPAAYLLDERGAIASSLALGAAAVLDLLETARAPGRLAQANAAAVQITPRQSRVPLGHAAPLVPFQAGALAPIFSLPQRDGGETAATDYFGRRLLLVFTDPFCPACDALIPQLEEIHRRSSAPEVLLVSREAGEATGAEAGESSLSCSTVLQQGWEMSLRFGVLATPAAYLIDEDGTIAAGPAVGATAVAQLLTQIEGGAVPSGTDVR